MLSEEKRLAIIRDYTVKNSDWQCVPDMNSERHLLALSRAIEQAVIADLLAGVGRRATDLSVRLRETADQQPGWRGILTSAADEIERYYGGMLAWKATAEAKDRDFVAAVARAKLQQREADACIAASIARTLESTSSKQNYDSYGAHAARLVEDAIRKGGANDL